MRAYSPYAILSDLRGEPFRLRPVLVFAALLALGAGTGVYFLTRR